MPTNTEHAAKLLKAAADHFRQIGDASDSLREEMYQRAEEYVKTSDLLSSDANGPSGTQPTAPASHDSDSTANAAKKDPPADNRTKPGALASNLHAGWLKGTSWVRGLDRPGWIQEDVRDPQEIWTAYSKDEPHHREWRQAILDFFKAKDGDRVLPGNSFPDEKDVSFACPTFLPRVVLAHATLQDHWNALFSITKEGDGYTARSFDFASPEVHRLNFVAPLQITGHELAYLRYFMYVVRGDEGAFRLLEDPILSDARAHLSSLSLDTGQGRLIDAIHPPRFKRMDVNGGLLYSAWILYAGVVFRCTLAVSPNGSVEMPDDEPMSKPVRALIEYADEGSGE